MLPGWLRRLAGTLLLAGPFQAAFAAEEVVLIDVRGAIGPATSAYVAKSLLDAEARSAELVVARIDTPGGLDTSMRAIVKSINASVLPVVGYVAPSGARAASAGTYILYASHVSAMAPGTNLGAATPVELGGFPGGGPPGPEKDGVPPDGDSERTGAQGGDAKKNKLVNDAVAYIRSLAQLRGRNAEWAETAVRLGASLPAEEALQLGVVDLIARDLDDLLVQLDGRRVELPGGERILATQGRVVVELEPDWQSRLLSIISNPNVAYILLLVGIYGLVYEFSNPGAVLPGTVGAVSLVLALYAFQLLPINYAGAALMLLGIALMVGEAFVPSFGALGVGGVAAFVVGSLILVDTDAPGFGLSLPLIITFATLSAVMMVAVIGMAVQSRRRPVVSGLDALMDASGRALSGFPGDGTVRVRGEVWAARSSVPIAAGKRVEIHGRDGLVLLVAPIDNQRDEE